MSKTPFYGDALPPRPTQKTPSKYKSIGGMVSTLDGVRVDVSDTATAGTYTSTGMPGEEFERMRRYALVLAKWSYPNVGKSARAWRRTKAQAELANRLVANKQFQETFGEDPTMNTVNIKPYINGLLSGAPNDDLVCATMSLVGTKAFDDIMRGIRSADRALYDILAEQANNIMETMNNHHEWANGLHQPGRSARRHANYYYSSLASYGAETTRQVNRLVDERKAQRSKPKRSGQQRPTMGAQRPEPKPIQEGDKFKHHDRTVIPLHEYDDGYWQTPYLAKHELVLPHTGKAGRRMMPWSEGKYPRSFYRMVTDPYRRIFQRKTRALGGVVVFDCSGSMGLDDDDIKRVMAASSGCSIVCYSASGEDEIDRKWGNIHLVARHGRQLRRLPDFPGGNGVDLPALKWAYNNLRLNSKSPVIWVSDGQVTGKGDHQTRTLVDMTNKFIKSKRIIQVHNPDEAVALLARLQRGRKS